MQGSTDCADHINAFKHLKTTKPAVYKIPFLSFFKTLENLSFVFFQISIQATEAFMLAAASNMLFFLNRSCEKNERLASACVISRLRWKPGCFSERAVDARLHVWEHREQQSRLELVVT